MSLFSNMRLTAAGSALLQLVHQGVTLDLVKIAVGNGAWSDDQQTGTPPAALVDQRLTASITAVEQQGDTAVVRALISNAGLGSGEGFSITELAVIADHPDDGEIVYMADYVEAARASYLPEASGVVIEVPVAVRIRCAVGSEVQIQIDDRFVSASLLDLDDHDQDAEAHDALLASLRIAAPTITSPADGATDQPEQPIIMLSAPDIQLANHSHAGTRVQIETAGGNWSTPEHDSGWLGSVEEYQPPADVLAVSTGYKVRARYRVSHAGVTYESDWSDVNSFTTRAEFTYVSQPTNISPASGATGVREQPTLTGSAFSVTGSVDTQSLSQFRILDSAGATVWDSGEIAAAVSVQVPAGYLLEGAGYTWQCRYKGTALGWSDWSVATGFTCASAFRETDTSISWANTEADWTDLTDCAITDGQIVASADGAAAYSDTELQESADGDWCDLQLAATVEGLTALTVDASSTTSALVLTSDTAGLLQTGDVLQIKAAATTATTFVELTGVTESGDGPYAYACTHDELDAVPELAWLWDVTLMTAVGADVAGYVRTGDASTVDSDSSTVSSIIATDSVSGKYSDGDVLIGLTAVGDEVRVAASVVETDEIDAGSMVEADFSHTTCGSYLWSGSAVTLTENACHSMELPGDFYVSFVISDIGDISTAAYPVFGVYSAALDGNWDESQWTGLDGWASAANSIIMECYNESISNVTEGPSFAASLTTGDKITFLRTSGQVVVEVNDVETYHSSFTYTGAMRLLLSHTSGATFGSLYASITVHQYVISSLSAPFSEIPGTIHTSQAQPEALLPETPLTLVSDSGSELVVTSDVEYLCQPGDLNNALIGTVDGSPEEAAYTDAIRLDNGDGTYTYTITLAQAFSGTVTAVVKPSAFVAEAPESGVYTTDSGAWTVTCAERTPDQAFRAIRAGATLQNGQSLYDAAHALWKETA